MRQPWKVVAAVIFTIGLWGCTAERGAETGATGAMTAAGGSEGLCAPYGAVLVAPYQGDPVVDGTPRPTNTPGAPIATCTPVPTLTPAGPTPTPFATSVALDQRSADRVATAPQNASLSPGNETVLRVVTEPGVQAVVWRGTRSFLVMRTNLGTHSWPIEDVLGTDGLAAVAISASGRIHVYAGGRYTYANGLAGEWQPVASAPSGGAPHMVVGPDGYARLFFLDGGSLSVWTQRYDGAWDGPVTLRGGVVDYDAIRVEDRIVVAATGGDTSIYLLPGGLVASMEGGDHVNLTYYLQQVVVGIGRASSPAAIIARSTDRGGSWSTCVVQHSSHTIESVAAIPTSQGPYAAFWLWHQPHGPMGAFRYIVLSSIHWPAGGVCSVFPELGMADALASDPALRVSAPGLVFTRGQQGRFRIGDDGSVLAYDGLNLNSQETDVMLVAIQRATLFSGPSLGFGMPGEEAP